MSEKKRKTFAQKYSSEFETLILEIVKSVLKKDFKIIDAQNTSEKKDGGYDGYCLIKSPYDEDLTTLLEAKLRSTCKDLPLSDFSKSIIVAVNLNVACIVIGTNIYFSGNSIEQLESFIYNTGLQIRTIDYMDIFNWLTDSSSKLDIYDKTFIKHMNAYAQKHYPTACRSLSIFNSPQITLSNNINVPKLYGNDRIEICNKIISEIYRTTKICVVQGDYGIGKKTLVESVIGRLNLKSDEKSLVPFAINKIDMASITSQNDFIYTVISTLWGCDYSETVNFFNNLSSLKEKDCLVNMIPNDLINLLMKLSNTNGSIMDIDIFFSYIASLYKKSFANRRIKRVFYFYNLEYSDCTIYNNIITFVRKMSGAVTIILCLSTNKFSDKVDYKWDEFCVSIKESANVTEFNIYEWDYDNAINFVKDCAQDREISNSADAIVSYFGKNPACLSAGIDLIKSDKLILSHIQSGHLKLDKSFDVNKLRSTFIYTNKKLSDLQVKIEYILFLVGEGINVEFIANVLCTDNQKIYAATDQMPFLKRTRNKFYWKEKFYADLFDGLECSLLTQSNEENLLCTIISNIELIGKSERELKYILLKVYIKLQDEKKLQEISKELLAEYKKEERLLDIFKMTLMLINHEIFNNNSLFNIYIRIEYLYSALKLGLNGEKTDFSDRFLVSQECINNFCDRYDCNNPKINLLIGRFYYIASLHYLANSNYTEMRLASQFGLDYLKGLSTDEALVLQSELCAAYATSLKHLKNIESCVSYLRNNETIRNNKKIKAMPRYCIIYHTHYASLFTGSQPEKALTEFLKIDKICKQYSREVYLHNLHNISSMQFILKNYNEALRIAKKVYRESYEYNISVEFGRCQNVLGCIMWKDKDYDVAKHYFECSYTHFKKHCHNTHVWAPLVNLSVLCVEEKDKDALHYTKMAENFLINNHIAQIKSANIKQNNIPKIIVAILMILRNYEILNYSEIKSSVYLNKNIKELYNNSVKGKPLNQIFTESAYNCEGIIMLKV